MIIWNQKFSHNLIFYNECHGYDNPQPPKGGLILRQ